MLLIKKNDVNVTWLFFLVRRTITDLMKTPEKHLMDTMFIGKGHYIIYLNDKSAKLHCS